MPKRRKNDLTDPQPSSPIAWFKPLSEPVRLDTDKIQRQARDEALAHQAKKAGVSAAESKNKTREEALAMVPIIQREEETKLGKHIGPIPTQRMLGFINKRLLEKGVISKHIALSTFYGWRRSKK
jgi:hypothetical protein